MKVDITKSIDIADSAPSLPIVKVVKGETRDDLSDHVANRLIELGCAKKSDDKKSGKDADKTDNKTAEKVDNTGGSDDKGSDAESDNADKVTAESLKAELDTIALENMDGAMGSEQKAKSALEAIGKERYKFDVDKRMSVDNIITAIVEAAFKSE